MSLRSVCGWWSLNEFSSDFDFQLLLAETLWQHWNNIHSEGLCELSAYRCKAARKRGVDGLEYSMPSASCFIFKERQVFQLERWWWSLFPVLLHFGSVPFRTSFSSAFCHSTILQWPLGFFSLFSGITCSGPRCSLSSQDWLLDADQVCEEVQEYVLLYTLFSIFYLSVVVVVH